MEWGPDKRVAAAIAGWDPDMVAVLDNPAAEDSAAVDSLIGRSLAEAGTGSLVVKGGLDDAAASWAVSVLVEENSYLAVDNLAGVDSHSAADQSLAGANRLAVHILEVPDSELDLLDGPAVDILEGVHIA